MKESRKVHERKSSEHDETSYGVNDTPGKTVTVGMQ